MSDNKTFHLAITMAGAISAGAYTAGVMDYLLEVLDKWEKYKSDDNFKKKVPKHNIKIEVLSGASAGGMTACISSILLHQQDKHSVNFETSEPERKKNRLYHSWVNLGHGSVSLTKDKSIFELLGDRDMKEILEFRKTSGDKAGHPVFPISFLDSSIIRRIAEDATSLSDDERNAIVAYGLPGYVAPDFDLFVTLTSLKGFKKTTVLQKNTTGSFDATFTVTDHRDLMMFNFCKTATKGIINVNLTNESNSDDGLRLLRNAAVSTGAFPVGLEYGFIERRTEYINRNPLLRCIHDAKPNQNIVNGNSYSSAMLDGGLINNEPFELTELLLESRLKAHYKNSDAAHIKRRYSMLLIDPFPSEGVEVTLDESSEAIPHPNLSDQYPFTFFGAIGQLVMVARTQLLVKSLFKRDESFIEAALDQSEKNTFLIAPRRYDHEMNKIENGSKAIACGTLGGFGGFLDKSFREHDFFLGRNNCKSFLQNHFKFKKEELDEPKSPFYKSYSETAKDIFLITNKNSISDDEWLPIIPDVNILFDNGLDRETVMNNEYIKNKFPQLSEKDFSRRFKKMRPRMLYRANLVLDTILSGKRRILKNIGFLICRIIGFFVGKDLLLGGVKNIILKELKEWRIIPPK